MEPGNQTTRKNKARPKSVKASTDIDKKTESGTKKSTTKSDHVDKKLIPDLHAMIVNDHENNNSNIGSVWIYNGTDQNLKLSINAGAPITLEKSSVTVDKGMNLGSIPVKRSPNSRECRFGELNTMEVSSAGQTSLFEGITIPNRVIALNKSLQMFVFYTAAVLSFDGKVLWAASLESEVEQ